MTDILTIILTFLASGAICSFATLKYTRWQSRNEAFQGEQQIYKQLIADLNADREMLREELRRQKVKMGGYERELRELKVEVDDNKRVLKSLQPFLCEADCQRRVFTKKIFNNKSHEKQSDSHKPIKAVRGPSPDRLP